MKLKIPLCLTIQLLAVILCCKSYIHEPQLSLKVKFPETGEVAGRDKLFQIGGSPEAPSFVNKIIVKISSGSYSQTVTHIRDAGGLSTEFEFTDVPSTQEINLEVKAWPCNDPDNTGSLACPMLYNYSALQQLSGSRETSEMLIVLNTNSGVSLDGIIPGLNSPGLVEPSFGYSMNDFGSSGYYPFCFDIDAERGVGFLFYEYQSEPLQTVMTYGYKYQDPDTELYSIESIFSYSGRLFPVWNQSCKFFNGSLIAPAYTIEYDKNIVLLNLTGEPSTYIIDTEPSSTVELSDPYLDFNGYWVLAWGLFDGSQYRIRYKIADLPADIISAELHSYANNSDTYVEKTRYPIVRIINGDAFALGSVSDDDVYFGIKKKSNLETYWDYLSSTSVFSHGLNSRYSSVLLGEGEYFVTVANESSIPTGISYTIFELIDDPQSPYIPAKSGEIQAEPGATIKHSEIFSIGENKAVILWSEGIGSGEDLFKIYFAVLDIYTLEFSQKKQLDLDLAANRDYFSPKAVHYRDGITLVGFYSDYYTAQQQINFKWYLF